MTKREEMLDRVRKSLDRPETRSPVCSLPPLDLTGIMPPLAPADYLAKFETEWEKVAGVAYRIANRKELEAVLKKILSAAETHTVILSGNPFLVDLHLADLLRGIGKLVTAWVASPEIAGASALADFTGASFGAGAGITGVDFALAESGTLVLSSLTERVQVASLAPPIHIALYRRSQLVGSLDEVLSRLPIASSPDCATAGRSVVFVTGTSRTADIEQILIRGVHGPREVHAILVEDSLR